jgi:putative two-component system response regulator
LLKSALLHDVGKIKIPDSILLKTDKLNDDEFSKIKTHTIHGKNILESLQKKVPNQQFLEYAKTLAYYHHERWDGKGYPENLEKNEIPLQARMMTIVDVYDALVSERPYKTPFTHEEAMEIIKAGRNTQFDPDIVDLFLSLSDKIKEIHEELKGEKKTST